MFRNTAQNAVIPPNFHIVSGDSSEIMRKLCVSTKFSPPEKLGEFLEFYAVLAITLFHQSTVF